MKANTNKKNKSASRKLVPAVAMLTTSAVMLSSATYAWFTLNREVEVTGLQMTATTPEDIQISLGAIGTPSEVNSLTNNGGFLTGDAPAADTDWSNIADISTYYAFGKLIPASSTNGENIFYTPDAAGVGRTLKSTAQFHQAVADDAATAHRYINADEKAEGKSWLTTSYSPSTSWNVTNDDGYYVDIPVWLRTSSANNQTIYVYGYACDKTEETTEEADTDDLYKAVRVAILDKDGKAN